MRKKIRTVILLIASGIVFLNLGLFFTGVQLDLKNAVAATGGTDDLAQGPIGIDVSELTDVEALGFLSSEEVSPWGHLFADETERIFLAEGDTVYVAFDKGHDVKPGDLFTVYKSSDELDHPLSGRDLGYVISFLGRVVLKKEVKPNLYKAQIVESYSPMRVGDTLFPFTWISPCVQLSNPGWKRWKESEGIKLPVVAAKELKEIMGQFSVVYMNHGLKHGIRRGNFFEIITKPETDRPKEPALPDQALGYLLVLESRPNTSTGIVITARREFSRGATLKAIDLNRELRNILIHYGKADPKNSDIQDNPLQVLKKLERETDPKPDLPEALRLLSTMSKCQTQ
ncbi:MAG: hypothetical protein JRI73_11870 [Deltaproteobacteria bacterium]|nr:hypothetical protein [Deltaproteobacteria bacterium]